jgi:phage repressor protein C with HTH and peptisase S24 domain
MNTISERILWLIDQQKISVSAFAKKAGLDQSNVQKMKKGTIPVSKKTIVNICLAYGVNQDWLVSGNGEPYDESATPVTMQSVSISSGRADIATKRAEYEKRIPYYDVDFTCSVLESYNDSAETISDYMAIPGSQKADFCCRAYGNSMTPNIQSGDIVSMKKIDDWQTFLALNEVYGIVTSNGLRVIKVLRRGSDSEHFTLHSFNSEFEDQEIEKASIINIYKVVASARIF